MPARPQRGLGEADVIYETLAEWDLTRFVAIFTDSSPASVGPVRSARAYHAAIAAEYEAALAHCAQVPSVTGVVEATRVVNLEGCTAAGLPGFIRDTSRQAPHNLYVNVATLRDLITGAGTYGPLGKQQDWSPFGEAVASVSFTYPEGHPVTWRYDDSRDEYLRWQDGSPHVDSAGRQIATTALVVQKVAVRRSSYYGETGYSELTLTGAGEALLYANGLKRAVTWRRAALADPTAFYDAQGERVLLPPGRTFVQLVGLDTAVEESLR